MVKVNFITNKEVFMMVIGNKIKWMVMVFYIILMDQQHIKVNGNKINLMEKVQFIMINKDLLMELLDLLILINLMINGLNIKVN